MDELQGLTMDELKRVAELGGIPYDVAVDSLGGDQGDASDREQTMTSEEAAELARQMALAAFSEDEDEFAEFAGQNMGRIRAAAGLDDVGERVRELLVLGYRVGISRGSGVCANDLGACYYRGDVVEQDFAKAKELYEFAASHGCPQSVVNLGYIYEYGRTGEPDYARAYECYAQATALSDSSEATYKLGDMYARGRWVKRDLGRAKALWERSLGLAHGVVEQAHPAVRVARLLVGEDGSPDWGIEPDPLRALALFQTAEIGLRMDIADGQTYYAGRLRQAVEGQATARAMLEAASA